MSSAIILVIEDDADHADLLGRALGKCGVAWHHVPTGEAAIEWLTNAEIPPDLVFLDVNMPGMSGHQVLHWIRARPHLSALPVVVLTTSERREDMQEALLEGASQFRTKPARWADWLVMVESLVSQFVRPFQARSRIALVGRWSVQDQATVAALVAPSMCTVAQRPSPRVLAEADVVIVPAGRVMHLETEWRMAAAWLAVTPDVNVALSSGFDEVVQELHELPQAISRARRRMSSRQAQTLAMGDAASFASQAAHDLRAPARRMAQLGALLEEEASELTDENRKLIGLIRSEGERLQQLITGMLGFALAPANTTLHPISLDLCVDDALADLRDHVDAVQPHIRRSALGTVSGNSSVLSRVFLNLLSNALHYRDASKPLILEIRSRQMSDGGLAVLVSDNGRGIAPDMLGRIFLPLVRAASDVPGTGLGLSIVQRAMVRLGGEVRVASELGVGTTFVLRFPPSTVV